MADTDDVVGDEPAVSSQPLSRYTKVYMHSPGPRLRVALLSLWMSIGLSFAADFDAARSGASEGGSPPIVARRKEEGRGRWSRRVSSADHDAGGAGGEEAPL